MDTGKFLNRFYPTLQFALIGFVAILMTISFVWYIFTGRINVLSFILFAIVGSITWSMTYNSFIEMKEVYNNDTEI